MKMRSMFLGLRTASEMVRNAVRRFINAVKMLPVFRKVVAYEQKMPITSMISVDKESGIVKEGICLEKTATCTDLHSEGRKIECESLEGAQIQQVTEKDDILSKINGCFDGKGTFSKNFEDVRSREYTFIVTSERHLELCTSPKGLICKCGGLDRRRCRHRSREPSRIGSKVKRGLQKSRQLRRLFKRKVVGIVPKSYRLFRFW